jgi:hypothetical protein
LPQLGEEAGDAQKGAAGALMLVALVTVIVV